MKRPQSAGRPALSGPTQRQLRAGELIRHALVDILREEGLRDPILAGVSITVAEVRVSPDLKHAICFVEPLGAGVTAIDTVGIVAGLNRSSKFLRGKLGRVIDMKFTPDLKFIRDDSFNAARHVDSLFDDPRVRRDLDAVGDGE